MYIFTSRCHWFLVSILLLLSLFPQLAVQAFHPAFVDPHFYSDSDSVVCSFYCAVILWQLNSSGAFSLRSGAEPVRWYFTNAARNLCKQLGGRFPFKVGTVCGGRSCCCPPQRPGIEIYRCIQEPVHNDDGAEQCRVVTVAHTSEDRSRSHAHQSDCFFPARPGRNLGGGVDNLAMD